MATSQTTDAAKEYAAARQGAVLWDLSAASKVEVAGPDAALFLHNLCTQDVKNLPVGAGCEAFLATAKARVVAHVAVSHVRWRERDAIWLDASPGQGQRILQHLDHFLISEQVELADRTGDLAMVRLVGPAAASTLAATLGRQVPALVPWHHVTLPLDGDSVLVRHQTILDLPAYDCVCDPPLVSKLRERLVAAGATPAGPGVHEVLRVEAGWPVYGTDMDENRFVVEVGRNAQAICYTKGCYLGQEPIVMARDRGQVNRALLGVLCGQGSPLATGTKLYHGESEVGQVTSSAISPRLGQAIALAYLRRGTQAPGTKLMIEPVSAGREAIVSPLPFPSA